LSRVALLLAIAVLLVAAEASAQERENLELVFSAPAECGDSDALSQQIERRSPKIRVQREPATNRAEVNVSAGPPYLARVVVSRLGSQAQRELSAGDCDELRDAIALVVVVTLDSMSAPPPETKPPTSPEPKSEPAPPEATANANTQPEPQTSLPAGPPQWKDDIEPPDLAGPIKWSSFVPDRWGVAVAARGHQGPAPRFMFGPEFGLELRWNTRAFVSTRLGVAVSRAWSGSVTTTGGTATFTLDQVQGELCPLRLGGAGWEIRPCLQGAWGRVLSEGQNTLLPQSVMRPWGTLGANARISGRPVDLLELWASAGIGAAMVRDAFQFQPEGVFHSVPAEIPNFALGVAVLFP
jgi:hypothetical protein